MAQRESLRTFLPLESLEAQPIKRMAFTGFNDLIEKVLSFDKVREIYDTLPVCDDPFQFIQYTLDRLQIKFHLSENDRLSIPPEGPVIVVANHPFGGIDGMLLALALSAVRKDIKILVNYFLESFQELKPLFFAVDPFRQNRPNAKNFNGMRQAVKWVREGHMLVVLPAGEVSHLSLKRRKIEDPQWSTTAARMVRLTKAPVLPFYFRGRNSALFQVAGIAHPRLRTAMLPRETLKKKGSQVQFKIGPLIPFKTLSPLITSDKASEYLRFRTYLLARACEKTPQKSSEKRHKNPFFRIDPIIRETDREMLKREVESLPNKQKLILSSRFEVFYADADQIPMGLREIGRLREKTFRQTGEGTGRSIDLDRFDNIYTHLVVWNTEKHEVVGAYRLAPTLEILEKHGKKGLYTHTLFRYSNHLLEKIGPALELGRTFVRAEYQKDYSPLMLLWKGIGQYIVQFPYYKTLFGAVSISDSYMPYSRQLMAAFLKVNTSSPNLSRMVKPRKPFRRNKVVSLIRKRPDLHRNDLNEISAWISCIEADGKGVPILLKQYLKLGGKLLSFHVDRKFGNTLDGLMFVDLTQTDGKVLKRYMGAQGYDAFMEHQQNASTMKCRQGLKR